MGGLDLTGGNRVQRADIGGLYRPAVLLECMSILRDIACRLVCGLQLVTACKAIAVCIGAICGVLHVYMYHF